MSKPFFSFLTLLTLGSLAGCAENTAAASAQDLPVIQTLPHDGEAYTQGFLFHDGFFYESTGLYGSSSLRKVEPETGRVLVRTPLDSRYFAEGLAALGGRLYQLTWRERTAFVYDLATLQPLGAFAYEGDGWGLTTDGTHLIMSDGTYRLRFLDPATFGVIRTLDVTSGGRVVSQLNELEYVRGEIWANIYLEERIARIDPNTGEVRSWVSTEGLISWVDKQRGAEVANGIAYDSAGERLWLTGKRWPKVFEVEVR